MNDHFLTHFAMHEDLPNPANSSRLRNSLLHHTDPSLHELCDARYTHRTPPISPSKSSHCRENTRDLPNTPHCLPRCAPREQSQHHPAARYGSGRRIAEAHRCPPSMTGAKSDRRSLRTAERRERSVGSSGALRQKLV